MPTELEELVEFLHHGNTQIRQVATQHLVPYSSLPAHQTTLFKRAQLSPLKDLKLLVRDYPQIAHDALTILINLTSCGDREILESFSQDATFVEQVLQKIVDDVGEENADLCCGLLANLVKDDVLAEKLVGGLERAVPRGSKVKAKLRATGKGEIEATKSKEVVELQVSESPLVLDQLMDVFVKGNAGSLNPSADFDYLSYVFADMAKWEEGRKWLLERREYDGVVPISKLVVFTEHGSLVRRKGVAGTIKNVAFEVERHGYLMDDESLGGCGLLPYLLGPLVDGEDEFSEEEMAVMLPELQLVEKPFRQDDRVDSTRV